MALDPSVIRSFNRKRRIPHPSTLCYAPEISMNFDQTGEVTACCFNRKYVLGRFPETTLMEIWQGRKIEAMRKALREDNLEIGCQKCERMLAAGNFSNVLISHFDNYVPATRLKRRNAPADLYMPAMFEFELSNVCNLECIMCGGKWSSAIRKNREGLPAIKSPYNDDFVAQVREFLPTLSRANFLGGEPFLISIYYEIWEDIVSLNPDIEVAVTSNGTTLNKRAKNIIEHLPNLKISLSIDSLVKETYESIRWNADFDVVKENIDFLLAKGKLVSFSVCPMIQNRMEIPGIVEYCENNKIDIFFNTVVEPLGGRKKAIHQDPLKGGGPGGANNGQELLPETSLRFLSAEELDETIDHYRKYRFGPKYQHVLNGLINQLEDWKSQPQEIVQEDSLPEPPHVDRTLPELKEMLEERLEGYSEWPKIRQTIDEIEASLREEDMDVEAFYRNLEDSPAEAIRESCLTTSPLDLFINYKLEQKQQEAG